MIGIKTKAFHVSDETLDRILVGQDTSPVDNLEIIDALIERANRLGIEVAFSNEQRQLSLEQATNIRFELGLDIR